MGADVTGGFLDRWSRRKRAAEAEAEAEAARAAVPEPIPSEVEADPAADPEAAAAAEEALIASLPRIEDITAGTDIRAFLQKGVPAALRNAALRRAWMADPLIAGYEDPARDYFWDWNAPGGVPGGGGTLDPDRVARMVRDIVGKDESQVQDSPDPAPGAEVAEPPAGEEAEDVAPAATAAPDDHATVTEPAEAPPQPRAAPESPVTGTNARSDALPRRPTLPSTPLP